MCVCVCERECVCVRARVYESRAEYECMNPAGNPSSGGQDPNHFYSAEDHCSRESHTPGRRWYAVYVSLAGSICTYRISSNKRYSIM